MKVTSSYTVDEIPGNLAVVLRAFAKQERVPSILVQGADVDTATYQALKTPADLIAQAILADYPTALAANYNTSSSGTTNLDLNPAALTPIPQGEGALVFGAIATVQGSTGVPASAFTLSITGGIAATATTQVSANSVNRFGVSLDNLVAIRSPNLLGAGVFKVRVLFLPGYQVQGGYAYSPWMIREAGVSVAGATGFQNTRYGLRCTPAGNNASSATHFAALTRGAPEIDSMVGSFVTRMQNERAAMARVAQRQAVRK